MNLTRKTGRSRLFPNTVVGALALATLSLPFAADANAIWGSGPVQKHSSKAVIVRLNGDLTPDREADLTRLSADIYRHLPIIDSVALSIPERNEAKLEALPFVGHVSDDTICTKADAFTVDSSLTNIADSQYGGSLNGAGVTVAVVDSGMQSSADFNGGSTWNGLRIVRHICCGVDGSRDPCGHGTHVSGIIGGNGYNSTGPNCTKTFMGIAPDVNFVDVAVLNAEGQGSVSNVIAGLQQVLDRQSNLNIRVVNLSLGHPVTESYTVDPLCQAVEQLWKSGIVVVCAAGNSGRLNATQTAGASNEGWGANYGSIQSPANDPYVITVGATKSMDGKRADDRIATYSSRGPTAYDMIMKPDIIAPGNLVISTLAAGSYLETEFGSTNTVPVSYYTTTPGNTPSNSYYILSGTSMAAPVVTGAVALMLQENPSLTPDDVKARLMISADKWAGPTGAYDPLTYGAGYLDVPAALACTTTVPSYATSPPLVKHSNGTVTASTILWGSNFIWGSVANFTIIWGSNFIWGSSTVASSTIIWGSSLWSSVGASGTVSASSSVDLSSVALQGE